MVREVNSQKSDSAAELKVVDLRPLFLGVLTGLRMDYRAPIIASYELVYKVAIDEWFSSTGIGNSFSCLEPMEHRHEPNLI